MYPPSRADGSCLSPDDRASAVANGQAQPSTAGMPSSPTREHAVDDVGGGRDLRRAQRAARQTEPVEHRLGDADPAVAVEELVQPGEHPEDTGRLGEVAGIDRGAQRRAQARREVGLRAEEPVGAEAHRGQRLEGPADAHRDAPTASTNVARYITSA